MKILGFVLLFLLGSIPARAEFVILISCDGTRPDAITAFNMSHTPTFSRLRREGSFTDNARTDVQHTTTLQNHTGMITGRPVEGPEGHNWVENGNIKIGQNLHRNKNDYLASVFDVAHDHGLRTALFGSKTKFTLYDISYDAQRGAPDTTGPDNGRDKIDTCAVSGVTVSLVDKLIAELKSDQPPQFAMLHLSNPDAAGHESGWKLRSKDTAYMKSIAMVDSLIGRVMETIDTTERLRGRTHVIVTADHGGVENTIGHEQSTRVENFRVPFYVWGPGVKRGGDLYALNRGTRQEPGDLNPAEGMPPIRNGEAGNLALQLLGLPAIPGSIFNARQDFILNDHPMEITSAPVATPPTRLIPPPPIPVAAIVTPEPAPAETSAPVATETRKEIPIGAKKEEPVKRRFRIFRPVNRDAKP